MREGKGARYLSVRLLTLLQLTMLSAELFAGDVKFQPGLHNGLVIPKEQQSYLLLPAQQGACVADVLVAVGQTHDGALQKQLTLLWW